MEIGIKLIQRLQTKQNKKEYIQSMERYETTDINTHTQTGGG